MGRQTSKAETSTASVLCGTITRKGDVRHDGTASSAPRTSTEDNEACHATVVFVKVHERVAYATMLASWEFFPTRCEPPARSCTERCSITGHVCESECATPSPPSAPRAPRWCRKGGMSAPVTIKFNLSDPEAGRAYIVTRLPWQLLVAEHSSRHEKCERVVILHRTSEPDLHQPCA